MGETEGFENRSIDAYDAAARNRKTETHLSVEFEQIFWLYLHHSIVSRLCTHESAKILFVHKRKKRRRLWNESPYNGVPGFYAAMQRFFYQFEGAAQLGDPNEPAYVPPADPSCPICAQSLKLHRIDRGGPGKPTHMKCPPNTQNLVMPDSER